MPRAAMKPRIGLALTGMLAMLVAATAVHAAELCRARRDLAGPCIRVHGRAALYNGNPTVRIWKVGTRRVLGVSQRAGDPDIQVLPPELRAQLDWDHPVFGDFVVCPLTRERPGVMRMVCVAAAARLRRGGADH